MHAYRDQYATLFRDGQNVVLIAISTDPVDTLAAWARDDQFQYLFASDSGSVVGKAYGAFTAKYQLDNRNLYVVGPDGKIAHREIPFREIDPISYKELGAALDSIAGRPGGDSGP
jgi:peroxiredoxin